jgi:phosphomevalonate kinase
MKAIAPGKVFLLGEYAVLEGAPALVLAVARYARARPSGEAPADLAALVNEAAAGELQGGAVPTGFTVDSSELRAGARKLGLGSSAASCVAGAGLLVHASGQSLASEAARRRVFRVARAAHDRLQGEPGSGADVAASVAGGLVRYESSGGGRWRGVHLPAPLRFVFVDTGVPASTRALVGRVRAMRSARPDSYQRHMNVLGDLAVAVGPDPLERSPAELCLLVHAYAAHLYALGQDAGADVVSEVHRSIAEIARAHGCAAKPSGAGGGDLAVIFCPDPASAAAVREDLCARGHSPIDLPADPAGVRLEFADGA